LARLSDPGPADPYNGSYSLADPQTLNRYAYVNNRPMNATDSQGLCDDGDWLCDLGDAMDALDAGMDSAATAVQTYTGLSLDLEPLQSGILELANTSIDVPVGDSTVTITAGGALKTTAMVGALALPGVGEVFDAGLAAEATADGVFGAADALGGSAMAADVGLPAGSEIAAGVDATSEANAVAESATDAASQSSALAPYYPPNDGFAGSPQLEYLQQGTALQRYGGTSGSYLAPAGTPPEASALAYGTTDKPLNYYTVVKPFPVLSGPATPWFGQLGLGTQYKSWSSIQSLLDGGYLQ
jgi:hypothetical protein